MNPEIPGGFAALLTANKVIQTEGAIPIKKWPIFIRKQTLTICFLFQWSLALPLNIKCL